MPKRVWVFAYLNVSYDFNRLYIWMTSSSDHHTQSGILLNAKYLATNLHDLVIFFLSSYRDQSMKTNKFTSFGSLGFYSTSQYFIPTPGCIWTTLRSPVSSIQYEILKLGWVLWYINLCWLFHAKSSLHIY